MEASQTLFRGGIVLTHDDEDHVIPIESDLLVEGNVIKSIERGIQASPGVKIIDCSDKIVCPGFIDTHHHLWQSLLKGAWNDYTLLDIFCKGSLCNCSQFKYCCLLLWQVRWRQHTLILPRSSGLNLELLWSALMLVPRRWLTMHIFIIRQNMVR